MKEITIFTPSYNRAHTLPKLYDSLLRQTADRELWEWVIVDDGSKDDTENMVEKWISDNKINIRYIAQPNGGKHRAINRGVREADGNLFFIVDSDDYLADDAIEWILEKYESVMADGKLAGLSGTRIKPDGTRIGGELQFDSMRSDAISIRSKHHVAGDLAEIYKTDILRRYPFPEVEGEKFCSEVYVWGGIAKDFDLVYFNNGIYTCEYLEGGLSDSSIKCRLTSPKGSCMTYSLLYRHPKQSRKLKLRYLVNFWVFAPSTDLSLSEKLKMVPKWSLVFASLGKLINRRYRQKVLK